MKSNLVSVGDAQLEVTDWGSGEPLVFVQTALTADELQPLAREPDLDDGYRKLLYHRRGYTGSSTAEPPGSVVRDAADCAALLTALGVERAHVVGFSYSAAVAMQLATTDPPRVSSLILIEPPPVHTPCAPDFRAATDQLLMARRQLGLTEALDAFMSRVIGPSWRRTIEDALPGAAQQMQRDAVTFFDNDMPALLAWRFGADDARRIACPVMHVGGSDSGPWFAQVRDLILDWFPHAEDVVIPGADHDLPLTHSAEIAQAISAFLHRHR